MAMPFVRRVLSLFVLTIVVIASMPRAAAAQSADDIASRVGTVARTMGAVMKERRTLDGAFTFDANRGNTDTTNLRGSIVYVHDNSPWRYSTYLSGATETQDGVKANERAGLNLALARQFDGRWRWVLLEEIVYAPIDGYKARNLFGGMAVWTPQVSDRAETSLYAGAGWQHEQFTTDQPDADYGALLAGATSSIKLSPTATLNLVGSYTQDAAESGNYKLGSSVALIAAINSLLGVHLSYAVAYDHAPVAGKVSTNNSFGAGITIKWKG